MVELTLRGVNFHFAPQGQKKGNPRKNMKKQKKNARKKLQIHKKSWLTCACSVLKYTAGKYLSI